MADAIPEVMVLANPEELYREATSEVARAIQAAVADHSRCALVLAGGNTPRELYRRLAADEWRETLPWANVHVYFGDERCVPPDDVDSNYRMAREALLDHVPIPRDQIFRMPGEMSVPESAAEEYESILRREFDLGPGLWPRFDLVLLGMGEDGHTASLFPGTPVLHEDRRLAAAPYVDKLRTYRLTLTVPVFNRASEVLFLTEGPKKAAALQTVLEGARQPERYPAQLIRPRNGRLLFMVDADAASKLVARRV